MKTSDIVQEDTRRQTASAQATAARASEHANALEVEAGRLKLALEAAKDETKRISEGLASRRVSLPQQALIASALRNRGGAVSVVSENQGDPETDRYAAELASAFQSAGLQVSLGATTRYPPPVGLRVTDRTDRAASDVARALDLANIPVEYNQANVLSPVVHVGMKGPRF